MRRWIALLCAAVIGVAMFVGCAKEDKVVLEVAGQKVLYSEYEIYLKNEKLKIAQATGRTYDEVKNLTLDDQGSTYESVAIENAQSGLLFNKMCEKLFNDRSLEYTPELEKEANYLFDQQAEAAGGKDAYRKQLQENGLSEEDQLRYMKAFVINTATAQAMYGVEGESPVTEEEIENEFHYNYYLIQPLRINKFENNVMLIGPQLQEKEKKYQKVKDQLAAGENFTTVLAEYGELELGEQERERGILVGSRIAGNNDYKEVLQNAETSEPGQVIYGETTEGFYALNWLPIDETVKAWGAEQVRKELENLKFQQYMEQQRQEIPYTFFLE